VENDNQFQAISCLATYHCDSKQYILFLLSTRSYWKTN